MKNVTDLISDLNTRRMNAQKKYDPKSFVSCWLEDEVLPLTSNVIQSLVIILRTTGCSWARNDFSASKISQVGGCSMCGYLNDCISDSTKIKNDDLIYQFNAAINKFDNKDIKLVKIFTSGSFLDDKEVHNDVQHKILNIVNDHGIKNVIVETRPEFINKSKVEQLLDKFDGQLQLAIGLESCNNKILKHSINKGFTFEDFCKAIDICRDLDISIKTYLLQKPPFLTERDSIIDVLTSIQTLAKDKLTDCISINPVHVQKFTVIEYLYNRNDFRAPWLWSVVEVLNRGYELLKGSEIQLLSHPTAGGTRRGPHNCLICDKTVLDKINKFSKSNDPNIFQNLHCNCLDIWRDVLKLENIAKSNLNIRQTDF